MIEIIPTILTDNPRKFEEKIRWIEREAKRVHIDIIDGIFANNKTVDLSVLEEIDVDLPIDVHLMTKEPVLWVERAVRAMADRIIGQIEMMSDQVAFVGRVTERGALVGLGIDLATPVSKLDPILIHSLDLVLVMGVKAGFGGQKFNKSILAKVAELNELRARDSVPFKICVDGGVDSLTIDKIRQAGADIVAVGHAVSAGDIEENLKVLTRAAYEK